MGAKKGQMTLGGKSTAAPEGVLPMLGPGSCLLPWGLWLKRAHLQGPEWPPFRPRLASLCTECAAYGGTSGPAPCQPSSSDKHFLPAGPGRPRGWQDNPPVFLLGLAGWRYLLRRRPGREVRGDQLWEELRPPQARTGDVEKGELRGTASRGAVFLSRKPEPWRRKINSGHIFLESGRTLLLSVRWSWNLNPACCVSERKARTQWLHAGRGPPGDARVGCHSRYCRGSQAMVRCGPGSRRPLTCVAPRRPYQDPER